MHDDAHFLVNVNRHLIIFKKGGRGDLVVWPSRSPDLSVGLLSMEILEEHDICHIS